MSAWIPVTEQLPDDDTTVLIALEDGEVWLGWHEGDTWFESNGAGERDDVTHWQHLPEPPQ